MASIYKDLMREGYYNFNLDNPRGIKFTEGYMVSFKDMYKLPVIDSVEADDVFDRVMALAIAGLQNLVVTNKDFVVGVWEKDGYYYIDFSVNIKYLNIALTLADECNQKAIWDCKNGVEIMLEMAFE